MSEQDPPSRALSRPNSYEERFRLYIDESGDHVFKHLDLPTHRYLCLLGVWFKNLDYELFHRELERFKQELFAPHPDDPVILHREEILYCRGVFSSLRDPQRARLFDERLLAIIGTANFRIVAVVIDKKSLWDQVGSFDGTLHPYHVGVGFIYERYREYLRNVQRCGDVMAESRGGKEDRLLKQVYKTVGKTVMGWWPHGGGPFQPAITSNELKVKPKSANIAGLQLADLLAHPCRQQILREFGCTGEDARPFAKRLLAVVGDKFHCDLATGQVRGAGKHLCPAK
jgi:hypothetical protein